MKEKKPNQSWETLREALGAAVHINTTQLERLIEKDFAYALMGAGVTKFGSALFTTKHRRGRELLKDAAGGMALMLTGFIISRKVAAYKRKGQEAA